MAPQIVHQAPTAWVKLWENTGPQTLLCSSWFEFDTSILQSSHSREGSTCPACRSGLMQEGVLNGEGLTSPLNVPGPGWLQTHPGGEAVGNSVRRPSRIQRGDSLERREVAAWNRRREAGTLREPGALWGDRQGFSVACAALGTYCSSWLCCCRVCRDQVSRNLKNTFKHLVLALVSVKCSPAIGD